MKAFYFLNYSLPVLLTSFDDAMEVLDNVDQVVTHADSISNGTAGFFEGIAAFFTAILAMLTTGGAIVTAIVGAIATVIALLIPLVEYLLPAIALFKMARKAGYKNAWFAFIPFLQTYLEFVIPRKQFNLLGIIKTYKREITAIVYICMSIFGTTISAGLQGIPVAGQFLGLCFYVLMQAFVYCKVYDLFITYGSKEKAIIIALLNVLIPGNLIYTIGLLTIMGKEPDYGAGNFYRVNTGTDLHQRQNNQYAYYQQPMGQPVPPQGYAQYPQGQPMQPQGYTPYPQGQVPIQGYPQQPVQPGPVAPQPVPAPQPVVAPQQAATPQPAPAPQPAPQQTVAPQSAQTPQIPPQNPQ
jgi:hypothetical protein